MYINYTYILYTYIYIYIYIYVYVYRYICIYISFNMLLTVYVEWKHIIYLKPQIFLFFLEGLSMWNNKISKYNIVASKEDRQSIAQSWQ